MPSKRIIVIGSSTGGPKILRQIFEDMPVLDACIVLVQHMPIGINHAIMRTIASLTPMDVFLAEEGMELNEGVMYIAPSEVHLGIQFNKWLTLVDGNKVNYVKPAVDVAMKSLVKGKESLIGVILTGLGRDGADGITHIKRLGGTTIAEDEASCAIYGMPKAAVETGYVDYVLNPFEIRQKLIDMAGVIKQKRTIKIAS